MSEAIGLVVEIERMLEDLKKEYTQFIGGLVKVEPYELRDLMMSKVKKLRNMILHRTEEKFRANNLLAKVQGQMVLWDRQIERKFSGDYQRPKAMRRPEPERKKEQAPSMEPKKTPVVISNPGDQRDRVVELYDEYMKLNLLLGSRKMVNFAKFQNFINSQTQKIQKAKHVDKVKYEVTVQDQKVVIKSKSLKED